LLLSRELAAPYPAASIRPASAKLAGAEPDAEFPSLASLGEAGAIKKQPQKNQENIVPLPG
jgi:hypothetical protein